MPPVQWPSSRDYVEAVQNPRSCFFDPELQATECAIDRLGMPFVTSGQFAYVFKLNHPTNGTAQAVRCFRSELGDREHRYRKISEHLDKVSAPYFPNFEYDSQGIMVAGRKLPILTMEWVQGHPLDVYLTKIINHSDVIRTLADFWLRALHMMHEAKMAHGDLQHGNIIVDPSNSFRLVDLDGMYVPGMKGLKAAELGHRHYQHPKRSHDHFNEKLDNFSGIVIYTSLLAIAAEPGLWNKFHDDNNIIFKQPDFENPRASQLFKALKQIGETKFLADVLEKACDDNPANCPSVLDFVKVSQTKLPNWMLNGPTITVDQSNREVKAGQQTNSSIPQSSTPSTQNIPAGTPWWQGASAMPSVHTASSSTPISNQAAPTAPISQPLLNPHTKRFALNYAFIGALLVWLWHPILKSMLISMGSTAGDLFIWEALIFVAVSYWLGHRKAKKMGLLTSAIPVNRSQTASASASPAYRAPMHIPIVNVPAPPLASQSRSTSSSRSTGHTSPSYSPKPAAPVSAGYTVPSKVGCYVASRVSSVFHKSSCKWAGKISYRNRVQFGSTGEALNRGFRPCGVCNP